MLDFGVTEKWSKRQCSLKLEELDSEARSSADRLNFRSLDNLSEIFPQQLRRPTWLGTEHWRFNEANPSLALSISSTQGYESTRSSTYPPYSHPGILPLSPATTMAVPSPTIPTSSTTLQRTPTLSVSHHNAQQWLQPGYGPHYGRITNPVEPSRTTPYDPSRQSHSYKTSSINTYTQYSPPLPPPRSPQADKRRMSHSPSERPSRQLE